MTHQLLYGFDSISKMIFFLLHKILIYGTRILLVYIKLNNTREREREREYLRDNKTNMQDNQ